MHTAANIFLKDYFRSQNTLLEHLQLIFKTSSTYKYEKQKGFKLSQIHVWTLFNKVKIV